MFLDKSLVLLTLLLAMTIPGTPVFAKEVPFSFYPEEYADLNESDWATMKSTLEAVLAVKPNQYIDDALAGRALFTIARISRVRWSDGARQEVANDLLNFVSHILKQEGRVAVEPTASATDARRRLVQRAIWCYGELAVPLDRQKITEIWTISPKKALAWHGEIRGALLEVLNRRYLDAAIPDITTDFREDSGTQATQSEKNTISRVLLKRKLASLKDQSEAWKHIWSTSKPADLRQVCTAEFRLRWYQRILLFKAVFAEPDERIPFALAEASQDVFEKYALLYSSVFLANMKLGANKPISEEFLSRLKVAAENVSQQATSQIDRDAIKRHSDYLKDATSSMRANVAKRRDEAIHRGGARGDEDGGLMLTEDKRNMPPTPPKVDPTTEHRSPKLSRPEDRGEDFTKLATEELVRRLAVANDIGERRKSAKVLGDRAIQQSLNLQDAERHVLEKYIVSQLLLTASNKGDERQEAIAQLQRLWRLSAPQLLDSLGHTNSRVQEAAIKNLCLMRNESIIKDLIARIEVSNDVNSRQGGVFALGMMREKRNPMVPDRKVLDDATSKELAERLIIPFLNRIEASENDSTMKIILANAKKFLDVPFDARPRLEARSGNTTPSQPSNVLSNTPNITPVTKDNAVGKPHEMPGKSKVSSNSHPYALVGFGSFVVLLGMIWFGCRRLRKTK